MTQMKKATHSIVELGELDSDFLGGLAVEVGIEKGLLLDKLAEKEGKKLLV